MCHFFDKRGYLASVVQADHHRTQLNSLNTNDGKPKNTATTLTFGKFSGSAISMLSEESDW